MQHLFIALCTANGHTWCGPEASAPAGCINVHRFTVADLPAVLDAMRDTFWRAHIRGNYFDHRAVTPERMAARVDTVLALQVAA